MVTPRIRRLLLASQSPRRRELLAGLDLPMEVVSLPPVDEVFPDGLRGGEIPLYLARLKMAASPIALGEGDVLLTADTIVWAEGQVLGKPKDHADACRMLRLLSGRTHQVFTGVAMRSAIDETSFVCRTDVTFAPLADAQIDYYVDHYRPYDKAGAYGIQEWIGYVGVEGLQGSYYNVMGLPVRRVYAALCGLGV